MKIISWNVNGLRANYKKGFLDWFNKEKPDFCCLQEVRARKEDLDEKLFVKDYEFFLNSAVKLGYSGTGIYTKAKPKKAIFDIGLKLFDEQARMLRLDLDDFILINLYIPHGGRAKENLDYKLEAYNSIISYLKKIKNEKVILVGDFNIAHKEIDLARPKGNVNNIMFTNEERRQIDRILDLGFIDTFREFNQKEGQYTWWSNFNNARERNIGWRIDYCFVLNMKIKNAFILDKVMGSDHCPIGIEL